MTLKEKFHQWLKTEPFSSKERATLREAQCVVIAEEFAIEFAEWIATQGYKEYSNGWAKLWDKGLYTINELLEIFKKEKGL